MCDKKINQLYNFGPRYTMSRISLSLFLSCSFPPHLTHFLPNGTWNNDCSCIQLHSWKHFISTPTPTHTHKHQYLHTAEEAEIYTIFEFAPNMPKIRNLKLLLMSYMKYMECSAAHARCTVHTLKWFNRYCNYRQKSPMFLPKRANIIIFLQPPPRHQITIISIDGSWMFILWRYLHIPRWDK